MSKKAVIIIIVVSLVFLSVMGAGFFILWSKVSPSVPKSGEESQEVVEGEIAPAIGPLYSLETFIVNLADKGGKRYLRVSMELELAAETMPDKVDQLLPKIRDCILMILPTRKSEDIQSVEGKNALREEITTKLNSLVGQESITNLYFTEFVTQ
jgi:flagellar FliL protein